MVEEPVIKELVEASEHREKINSTNRQALKEIVEEDKELLKKLE